MRGLKCYLCGPLKLLGAVALLVSAWIEISFLFLSRGVEVVALLVSAWIEIALATQPLDCHPVALLVSAWIEIYNVLPAIRSLDGRTPRECVD